MTNNNVSDTSHSESIQEIGLRIYIYIDIIQCTYSYIILFTIYIFAYSPCLFKGNFGASTGPVGSTATGCGLGGSGLGRVVFHAAKTGGSDVFHFGI